jgi:hypothetical protein
VDQIFILKFAQALKDFLALLVPELRQLRKNLGVIHMLDYTAQPTPRQMNTLPARIHSMPMPSAAL